MINKAWAYAILAVVIVGAGATNMVYNAGKDSMRAEYAENERKLKKKLDDLKASAALKLQTLAGKQLIERRKADAKIQRLYRQNQALRAWWDTPVPIDAVNHAYGVPKRPAAEPLRPRP